MPAFCLALHFFTSLGYSSNEPDPRQIKLVGGYLLPIYRDQWNTPASAATAQNLFKIQCGVQHNPVGGHAIESPRKASYCEKENADQVTFP